MSEDVPATCPSCGASVPVGSRFCESCGQAVTDGGTTPSAVAPVASGDRSPTDLDAGPISAPTHRKPVATVTEPASRECAGCGGTVGPDGYCETCGTKAPSERDHFRESPASWVAGVCDRGVVHATNEDAMALLASTEPGERAVLVVLDGVSNTTGAVAGSLAGARAAREVLRTPFPRGMGTAESRSAAITKVLADAVSAANEAVVAASNPADRNPASATFSTAVLEEEMLACANVGDSRVYWLPDEGPARQLTVDDSAAQEQMAAGVAREVAETSAQAHAITRWLGRDSHDITPRVQLLELTGPGWVVVCSDGLWNYASAPDALEEQLRAAGTSDPPALALALTAYAIAQGGHDNITVALARVEIPAPVQNANVPQPDTDQQQRESDG